MSFESDKMLSEILSRLKTEFNPTKAYLFGSRAAGTHRPNSDYDIVLVVKSTDSTRIQNMAKCQKLLWDLDANVDVFVYPEDEFNQLKDDFSSIPEVAVQTGQEISLA